MARSGPWTFADGGETWRKDVKEVLAEDSGLYARVGGGCACVSLKGLYRRGDKR